MIKNYSKRNNLGIRTLIYYALAVLGGAVYGGQV